jgi:hypothetical protein
LKAPAIVYNGAPAFRLIVGTPIARAINADKDVFKAGDLYYLCADGVWFSGSTATGPWSVTGTIPASMYQIPPSSPAYRVTHVVVEDDYDTWTVFGTTAAYTGTLVAGDTVVWGTGIGPGTYGVGAWYNPWTGSFGRARSGYGPPAASPLSASAYESWDPRLVRRADRPLASRGTPEVVGTAGGVTPVPAVNRDSRVFAGRDGTVYRRRGGVWEKRDKGAWVAFAGASLNEAPIRRQLEDDARARARGVERTRAGAGLVSEWGRGAASYRPGDAGRGRR